MPTYLRSPEHQRLEETGNPALPWKKWGPYLSERQWGTVREDYSASGTAWDYFPHEQARSRAYHWGEDGLAGISDDKQRLCFAVALWNGVDPILKERLFGLTNSEGRRRETAQCGSGSSAGQGAAGVIEAARRKMVRTWSRPKCLGWRT